MLCFMPSGGNGFAQSVGLHGFASGLPSRRLDLVCPRRGTSRHPLDDRLGTAGFVSRAVQASKQWEAYWASRV